MTVLGTRNHSPITQGDTATTLEHGSAARRQRARATTPMQTAIALTVTQLNGTSATQRHEHDGAAVTIDPHGSFTYDPTGSTTLKALPDGAHMTDSFTYTVDDGHGGTSSATVSITVTGVNDPPVAVNDGSARTPVATTSADTPLADQSTLFGNDTDPDTGDTHTLKLGRHDEREGRRGHGQQRREVVVRPVELVDASSASTGDIDDRHVHLLHQRHWRGDLQHRDRHCGRDRDKRSADRERRQRVEHVDHTGLQRALAVRQRHRSEQRRHADPQHRGHAERRRRDGDGQQRRDWSYDPTTSATLPALSHGSTTTDTFTYSVKDNHEAVSNTATVTVTVTDDHPPVANPDNQTTSQSGPPLARQRAHERHRRRQRPAHGDPRQRARRTRPRSRSTPTGRSATRRRPGTSADRHLHLQGE